MLNYQIQIHFSKSNQRIRKKILHCVVLIFVTALLKLDEAEMGEETSSHILKEVLLLHYGQFLQKYKAPLFYLFLTDVTVLQDGLRKEARSIANVPQPPALLLNVE